MKPQELKDIAPLLFSLKTNAIPFSVPNNYFDDLENSMLSQVNLEKQLEKEVAFDMPNDYFNQLEDKVLNHIKAEVPLNSPAQQAERRVISLNQRLKKLFAPMAIAACLVLFFSIFYKSNSADFNSLPNNEISEWLSLEIEEIDTYEIVAVYDKIDIDAYTMIEELPIGAIENYLILNNIESIILEN
jgi:hypothetical protein